MAKIVKVTLNNETAYPVTITDAIVDLNENEILSAVIAAIKTEATGWTLAVDDENNMVYNLKDANGTVKGSIDMSTLGGGNLNGTVVSDIEYSDITSIFN